ncbi:MAG TPA: 16S rRNA (guanine(527)-N(7))-methyltransferase RsmG [Nitrospirae bacterium]|nr:ribosomal RNA small subunit methyltransferase G [bacterium BMS3Abin10]GBE38026.1 ribosomal RNA small subunit methyltransferase G [bacterium BMS3Bbin08]HDK17095.1 16S rRNA (guanine(527)-N(7))-methyltransferase RsmG [Nitrospirota bacterium]HDK82314.1 16S rRNA (guanine(527)-N(7))-methyltransferase RsmG [Nitrospirota bacterium]HDO26323.1 16S rRNA (guanine(527)-N(7))-methyltransferase RsmG [Nitrospirota bacterium]
MKSKQLLKKGLDELGISCSKEQINAFMTYLSELKKWNRAYNLTALKTDEDIIIKHFLDSLLYLKAVPARTLNIADFGTGAGFPGIPIRIIRPEIKLALVDSSGKKCAFLRHITRTLDLNEVRVLESRVEALAKEHKRSYDVIVSRATFKIKDFIKKACPYIKENGTLVLSKGPRVQEEIKEVEKQGLIKKTIRLQLSVPGTRTLRAQRNLLVLCCPEGR